MFFWFKPGLMLLGRVQIQVIEFWAKQLKGQP
jgi:hypothetical protein